jgi:hypothetical protein
MARVLEYVLEDGGWARSAILLPDRRIELCASYIHDTFLQMLQALVAACGGQHSVEWTYFHEPQSTVVSLTNAGAAVELVVRRFKDFRVPRPRLSSEGSVLGSGDVRLRDVVSDAILAGSRMLEQRGEIGYARSWRRTFPGRELDRLKQLRRQL